MSTSTRPEGRGLGLVEGSRIRREVIAKGWLLGKYQRARAEFADHVLIYRDTKLALAIAAGLPP
jgi:type I restriction enzyme R subunit